jgi:hypothetical protein
MGRCRCRARGAQKIEQFVNVENIIYPPH